MSEVYYTLPMKLDGKVALVTGAARRVGREIALSLARRGARLALHYRSSRREAQSLLKEIRENAGVEAHAFRAELADGGQVQALARAVLTRFGAVHVLVNNASAYEKNDFGRTSAGDFDKHMDTNLRAPFLLSQALAPAMIKAGGGKIINIADWAAHRPYAGYIPYCVSKAGLLCLNQALAKALAPKIQVNAVLPGPVLPPENFPPKLKAAVAEATLLKRLGSPKDVAQAVLFLLESGDFITGAELPVDGGRLIA